MSTSAIFSNNFSQLDSMLTGVEQISGNFKQLGADLKSGNMAAAQQDIVTLSQEALASPFAAGSISTAAAATSTSATSTSSSTSTSGTQSQSLSPLEQDIQTLGQDLQSGNLSGAQQAFSQIQQAMQQGVQGGGGHHHGHHHHGSSSSSSSDASGLQALLSSSSSSAGTTNASASTSGSSTSSTASATSSTAASATASSSGASSTGQANSLATDFQNLGQALHNGNLSAAQQAFTQLTQDAKSASGVERQPHAEHYGSSGSALIQALAGSQGAASAASSSGLNVSA